MKKILFVFSLLCSGIINSQNLISEVESLLDDMSDKNPALNDKMRIDVAGLSLYDFLNAVAVEHEINISADTDLNTKVQSSFFDIPVKDVFSFAAQKYNLDISLINDIIIFKKKIIKKEVVKPVKEKEFDVDYNARNKFLSVKLSEDDLFKVTKRITDLSNRNFVLAPEIRNEKVSAYIVNRPINEVIEMIAKANGLQINLDEKGTFYLAKSTVDKLNQNDSERVVGVNRNTRRTRNSNVKKGRGKVILALDPKGYLNIETSEASAYEIILEAAEKLNINYVIYNNPIDVITTFKARHITFDELLNKIFADSEFTYSVKGELYIIGLQTSKGLRDKRLIQLENRTIETVLETLPQKLLEGVDVKEFVELNGIMVSGSKPRIDELQDYIEQIDKVVPMILIEVIIAQYQKSHQLQTGMQAGLGSEPSGNTTGILFPQADVQLGASSINKLIEAFNGLGIFNLGKVTERFYLDLKYLENNSVINLQSTPKISTLNGHDARLSIGETSYYFEQNNRLINSGIGNDILQSGVWKPTEANLSLNITPFVSKDEQITLTIGVERSSFLGRQGENAPPGKATQQFESLIRCKNGEMILLGGLDELEKENSGSGTPFLSRIPVVKWFFSGRNKRKEKSKLHIFIKPTIVY